MCSICGDIIWERNTTQFIEFHSLIVFMIYLELDFVLAAVRKSLNNPRINIWDAGHYNNGFSIVWGLLFYSLQGSPLCFKESRILQFVGLMK